MKTISEIAAKLADYDPDKVLWVCYRFHPESKVSSVDPMDKNLAASEMSGITMDLHDAEVVAITNAFFKILQNTKYELAYSLEVHMCEMLQALREPIGELGDDKAAKTLETKDKFGDKIEKVDLKIKSLLKEITLGETEAESIIRRAMANSEKMGPEGFVKKADE